MERLNRDQSPALFTVVTSVASGLAVAIILNTFRTVGPLWSALAFGGVAVMTWFASSIFLRARKRSRAFLVTPAFSQKYFIAALVQRLHSALDRNGIDLVLKVPDRDYDACAQSQHLSRLSSRRHEYVGGIIIATEVHRIRDDLVTFCRKSRLPVVFTDIEPFERESEYPANSTFVGYDTGELGELGGRWLVEHLRGRNRPHVLIIASREHPARQIRCAQALREGLGDVDITTDDRCEFTRSRAQTAVRAHIRQLAPDQHLDAIFCTNDEMALGAVDALTPPSPATTETVVVGIDGVLEATSLIDTAGSPLRATVVQDTHHLAVTLVDFLEKMQHGRTVPKRTILTATIYETNGRT